MNSPGGRTSLCFWFRLLGIVAFIYSTHCADAQTRPRGAEVEEFFTAIQMGDTNAAAALLESNTNLAFAGENFSKLPLLEAAAAGNAPLVKRLIQLGADINATGDTRMSGGSQMTALHEAIKYDRPQVCQLLLESGANPNVMAFGFTTPLHLAFSENREEMAGWLLDYGAEPFQGKLFSNDETTPFELAITRSNGRLAARMLGQDPKHPLGKKSLQKPRTSKRPQRGMKTGTEVLSQHGNELLTAAAQRGELEAVQALLSAGVSVNNSITNCPTLLQSFSLAANDNARNLPSATDQWHRLQDQLKADYISKADANFVASLRAQEASQADKVAMMVSDRWRKVLDVLIDHGADYDAFAATALGDIAQANKLLSKNKNVIQARDCKGETPLHWAIHTEQPAMLTLWISAGVPLDATNDTGQTALHLAASTGKADYVKTLLAAKASTSIRDTNGWTALDAAIQNKQSDCIHLLLPQNPAAGHPERGLSMSLHEAAAAGNVATLVAILETETNLESRNELGLTPLHVAGQAGQLGAAAFLIDQGADVNARDPDGNTVLHQILLSRTHWVKGRPSDAWVERRKKNPSQEKFWRVYNTPSGYTSPRELAASVAFFLACGADTAATNHAGQTILQLVTADSTMLWDYDRAAILPLLQQSGNGLNERDADGNTALHRLCTGFYDVNKVESMVSLIASGADVNATNNLGQTPLHKAAEKIWGWDNNDPPVNEPFQLLVYKKADVNARDNQGRTPLHVVSISDSSFKDQATRLLISAGANPNLQDNEGMTPLHLVASSGQAFSQGAVQGLLDAGAKPNIQDKKGRTSAHLFLMGAWPWDSSGACLKDLAAAKADFSIKDDQGKTPLHYLAALGSQSPLFFIHGIDQIFVDAKVDFQAKDNDGNTPAIIAAKTGTKDVFDWLVKQEADLDITNNQGETARLLMAHKNDSFPRSGPGNAETDIFQAAREGNMDAASRLLKADPSLVDQTNQYQQTPLRLAVTQHQTNMVNFLETHGAKWDEGSAVMAGRTDVLQAILKQNPSAVASKVLGKGLIHMAAANGDLNTVKILIEANCDLQSRDNRGLSPLGYALIKKHPDVQELLLQHGAMENFFDAVYANDLKTVTAQLAQNKSLAAASDSEKISAIDIAVAAGYTDILKLLLKNGAPIASAGRSPIQLAAFYNQADALALLIRAGAKVDQVDQLGLAPLHWAAIRGATEAADMLLKHKADAKQVVLQVEQSRGFMMGPDGGTIIGATPLHLAALCGETNLIQLLLKSGADVNALNGRQQTPLDLVSGMPPMNPFGIIMIQRGMMGLLEPLGVNPAPVNQLQSNREGRKSAAELLKAAGGKHSQNNQPFGGRWGPP